MNLICHLTAHIMHDPAGAASANISAPSCLLCQDGKEGREGDVWGRWALARQLQAIKRATGAMRRRSLAGLVLKSSKNTSPSLQAHWWWQVPGSQPLSIGQQQSRSMKLRALEVLPMH